MFLEGHPPDGDFRLSSSIFSRDQTHSWRGRHQVSASPAERDPTSRPGFYFSSMSSLRRVVKSADESCGPIGGHMTCLPACDCRCHQRSSLELGERKRDRAASCKTRQRERLPEQRRGGRGRQITTNSIKANPCGQRVVAEQRSHVLLEASIPPLHRDERRFACHPPVFDHEELALFCERPTARESPVGLSPTVGCS